MIISRFGGYALGVCVAIAMLSGCGAPSQTGAPGAALPSGRETGLTPLSAQRLAALTMPHYQSKGVHTDHGKSWMTPDKAKKKNALLYVGDWSTNDVYVFNYPSLAFVGTLTGFDEPYGMCVDGKGDVFVTNFGTGTTDEYAHGGTSPLNTFTTSGYSIGCSVSGSGNLAVTDFYTSTGAGTITIWKNRSGSGTSYSDPGVCYYMWGFGYDNKGNLIGIGEYDSIRVCALMAGSQSMTTLSTSGFTIDFAGGTAWDGEYIALSDQEAGGKYQSGIIQTTLSGSTLTEVGETTLDDNCYSDYVDVVNPFFFSKKKNITPRSTKQATLVGGPNLWCYDKDVPAIDIWAYPAGGLPIKRLTGDLLADPYGFAISIGK